METVTPLSSSARVRQSSAQMGNRAPFQGNPVRETDLLFSRGEPPTERNFDRIIEDKPKACSKVTPTAEETERLQSGRRRYYEVDNPFPPPSIVWIGAVFP